MGYIKLIEIFNVVNLFKFWIECPKTDDEDDDDGSKDEEEKEIFVFQNKQRKFVSYCIFAAAAVATKVDDPW